jgi:glyoxylase-like metal-dependent hydrolase (beta-lactamase superfamily II)
MEIKTICVGMIEENCYIITKDNYCLVVDPGDEYPKIKEAVGNFKVIGILITHYHQDHIGALDELIAEYQAPIYDYQMKDQKIELFDFSFNIIYNPGHKGDSVSFYFEKEKVMFCGDFLFKDSIGRTDLNDGNPKEMVKSLMMIKNYDNDIILYPGHGPLTTLGYEKKNNGYLKNINNGDDLL